MAMHRVETEAAVRCRATGFRFQPEPSRSRERRGRSRRSAVGADGAPPPDRPARSRRVWHAESAVPRSRTAGAGADGRSRFGIKGIQAPVVVESAPGALADAWTSGTVARAGFTGTCAVCSLHSVVGSDRVHARSSWRGCSGPCSGRKPGTRPVCDPLDRTLIHGASRPIGRDEVLPASLVGVSSNRMADAGPGACPAAIPPGR
jgi:hypothetical protein